MKPPPPLTQQEEGRAYLRKFIAERNLCGLANDTRWGRFLDAMRARKDWRPSYRAKLVNGHLADWDVEWFAHVPEPLGIEWMDIVFRFEQSGQAVDHGDWIEAMVKDAGLEYLKGNTMIRIFGYSPKDMGLFDE